MVGWFDPPQLFKIAVQTYRTSGVVSLVDEREIEALLESAQTEDYSSQPDFWFDYVADIGDGFDSAYSVAYALAQPSIGDTANARVRFIGDGPGATLPRGRVLIMGGDEVYPSASRDYYEDRLVGPYRAALPFAEPPGDLFAIPGNHDWYDGLVSFLRLFCQPRWIGGWRTKQKRSYFALRLPHRWWVWATDIQLERDIDKPQMSFFEKASLDLSAGDRVILCTAEPAWVQSGFGARRPYESLSYIERNLIESRGAMLAVTLTGDRHNYTRFQTEAANKHKINAGGGGAFLSGTHDLPQEMVLPKGDSTERLRLRCSYPDARTSRSVTWRSLALVWWNRGFGVLLAALYMLYGWLIQSASRRDLVRWPRERWPNLPAIPSDSLRVWARDAGTSFMDLAVSNRGLDVTRAFFRVLVRSPSVAAYTLFVVGVLTAFALTSRRRQDGSGKVAAYLFGIAHATAHLAFGVALLVMIAKFNNRTLGLSAGSLEQELIFVLELTLLGAIGGWLITALYLIISNRTAGLHDQEVFSAQSNPNYKNFLRLNINGRGQLRIYPIGIDKPPTWGVQVAGAETDPWLGPVNGEPLLLRLIEQPIVIP